MRQTFVRLAPLVAVMVLSGAPARAASIVLSVGSVSAAPGSTNDFFDVTIQNTAALAQNIAAFSLGLSVGDSHITLTGADESTALTYLFNGDSFDIMNSLPYANPPGQSLQGSDLSNGGSGTDLSASAFGLGRFYFSVAADAPLGPIAVTLTPDCGVTALCTSLSDSAGNDVAFSVANGAITITSPTGAAPEPSTWLLALIVLPAMAWKRRLAWKRS